MSEHIFQYTGLLKIKKSKNINIKSPSDDKVNWLFLENDLNRYSFIYSIKNSDLAKFNDYFIVELKFLMDEAIKDVIDIQNEYVVYRGEEKIGLIKSITPSS